MYRDCFFDIYRNNGLFHQSFGLKKNYRDFLSSVIYSASVFRSGIRVLDLCERFDPYRIAHYARGEKRDAVKLFENIFISRVFTVYQFSESIREIVNREKRDDLLIVSSIRNLFKNDDISERVRENIFNKAVKYLNNNKKNYVFVEREGNIFYGGPNGKDFVDFYSTR